MDPRAKALDGLARTVVCLAQAFAAEQPSALVRAQVTRVAETVAQDLRVLARAMQLPGAELVGARVLDRRSVAVPERAHELEQVTGHVPVEAL